MDNEYFYDELREAAEDVLRPGMGYGEWQERLFRLYPAEVVDALGSDRAVVSISLKELFKEIMTQNKAL